MVWCPYSGVETDLAACNSEHIIPLSLGGSNGFTLPVNAKFNAQLGSAIDAALSTMDLLTVLRRRHFDARGHSGKEPEARVKHATYGPDKRVAQVTFKGDEGLTVWDARSGREVPDHELAWQQIQVNFNVTPFDRIRFVSKVALAAGYAIYGDVFKETADHAPLRALMNTTTPIEAKKAFANSEVRGFFEHMPIPDGQERFVKRDQALCETVAGSVVIAIPTKGSVVFMVGILGQWVGMLNVPADTRRYPKEGLHDLGHAVLLVDGKTERVSYREFLRRALEVMSGEPVPMPQEFGG